MLFRSHPYFSTDTGIVLRAIELDADAILLAKAIDGVYDSDPKINPKAFSNFNSNIIAIGNSYVQ